jgi:hypothetical protein
VDQTLRVDGDAVVVQLKTGGATRHQDAVTEVAKHPDLHVGESETTCGGSFGSFRAPLQSSAFKTKIIY